MNRLIKHIAEEEYTYKFESPIIVNFGDEDSWKADTEPLTQAKEYESDIKDAVSSDMAEMGPKGLAEYLNPEYNKTIYPYIKSIIVTVDNYKAVTIVKANKELTSEEKDAVRDYISGQYSDGWGEGFEQEPINSFEDEYDDYGEDEDGESYTERVKYTVTVSASFWDHRNWYIKEI